MLLSTTFLEGAHTHSLSLSVSRGLFTPLPSSCMLFAVPIIEHPISSHNFVYVCTSKPEPEQEEEEEDRDGEEQGEEDRDEEEEEEKCSFSFISYNFFSKFDIVTVITFKYRQELIDSNLLSVLYSRLVSLISFAIMLSYFIIPYVYQPTCQYMVDISAHIIDISVNQEGFGIILT